ncbi:MAG: hypothetical protein HY597_05665 [Candidatus Omnitrophica bacterium]|nr:hypothetical protein [Candidatus Omnitrophota bacterium]
MAQPCVAVRMLLLSALMSIGCSVHWHGGEQPSVVLTTQRNALRAGGPRLVVRPMQIETVQGHAGVRSPDALTALLVERLRAQGLEASLEGASAMPQPLQLLACRVTRLDWTEQRRYPRRLHYEAELSCALIDISTGTVRWERRLTQPYDEMVLFNTMTKLPPQHGEVLMRECVRPLWDDMALGVLLFAGRTGARSDAAVTGGLE